MGKQGKIGRRDKHIFKISGVGDKSTNGFVRARILKEHNGILEHQPAETMNKMLCLKECTQRRRKWATQNSRKKVTLETDVVR